MKREMTTVLVAMGILCCSPACVSRKKSDHSAQMDARHLYDSIRYDYEGEIKLMHQLDHAIDEREERRLERKLRSEILLKNEQHNQEYKHRWFATRMLMTNKHENYPYIQYKEVLDHKIERIEKELQGLYWKNEGIGSLLRKLLKDLDGLKRYVVTSKEYQDERKLIEQLKIKQQEIEQQKRAEKAAVKEKKKLAKQKKS